MRAVFSKGRQEYAQFTNYCLNCAAVTDMCKISRKFVLKRKLSDKFNTLA